MLLLSTVLGASAQSPAPPGGVALFNSPSTYLAVLKNLFVGSRWNWFDNPDLKGKEYWVEFYHDGKMYTGWNEAFKWELVEPSTIHLTCLTKNDKEYYMIVDPEKKTARPDPTHLTRFNSNSMSFKKRVSANPPKGVKF